MFLSSRLIQHLRPLLVKYLDILKILFKMQIMVAMLMGMCLESILPQLPLQQPFVLFISILTAAVISILIKIAAFLSASYVLYILLFMLGSSCFSLIVLLIGNAFQSCNKWWHSLMWISFLVLLDYTLQLVEQSS